MSSEKVLLLVTQVYVPDPTAVGQYMAGAAEAMAKRGWDVRVLTANRGYDNPQEKYPASQTVNGVKVRRLPLSSLGKKTLLHRIAAQLSFCVQAFFHGLFTRNLQCVLVTTSPPMGSIVGWAIGLLRPKVEIKFWVMDINPDQAIVLGKARAGSTLVRLMDWLNRSILRRAGGIVVLDRMMEQTMLAKLPEAAPKMHVMPPWPMEDQLERIEHADNPFRKEHGLEGKFVVMYSGNHSLVHPLSTVLDAALAMQDDERVVFLFVGGGAGKQEVEDVIARHKPRNILSLPYQPLESIRYSLSAADVHLVSMGEPMVGIVHPCKFYGAMALAKPILLIGPQNCHIADVLREHHCGWQINHGDAAGAEHLLRSLPDMPQAELDAIGQRGRAVVDSELSEQNLTTRMAEILESRG